MNVADHTKLTLEVALVETVNPIPAGVLENQDMLGGGSI